MNTIWVFTWIDRLLLPLIKSATARQHDCLTRHWLLVRFWIKSSKISLWYLSTVLDVSGTRVCQMLAIEFWILGVGSNWYRYKRGTIFGRWADSWSPADAAIVENPNAAPYWIENIWNWLTKKWLWNKRSLGRNIWIDKNIPSWNSTQHYDWPDA